MVDTIGDLVIQKIVFAVRLFVNRGGVQIFPHTPLLLTLPPGVHAEPRAVERELRSRIFGYICVRPFELMAVHRYDLSSALVIGCDVRAVSVTAVIDQEILPGLWLSDGVPPRI